MQTKTERITILGTADFKAFLKDEARKHGISLSELVRRQCMGRLATQDKDEELIRELIAQIRDATSRAQASLDRGIRDIESALVDLRAKNGNP